MKKMTFIMILLAAAAALSFGQNLEALGYTVLETETADGYTVLTLQDTASGMRFQVYYKNTLSNEQITFLKETKKILFSWKTIVPSGLKIVFEQDQYEIMLVPGSIVIDGKDYAPYIPSEISFYYDSILEYDFRIIVEQMALRISGPYFNEEQLLDKLQSAVNNPIAYIESHDPEHIVRRMGEISDTLEEVKAEQKEILSVLESSGSEIGGLQETAAELIEQLAVLKTAHEELAEAHLELQKDYRLLKLGTIAVSNQGIFSTVAPFRKEVLEEAVKIKESNPSFTQEELLKACAEQGVPLSGKEAFLLYMVYFNEF